MQGQYLRAAGSQPTLEASECCTSVNKLVDPWASRFCSPRDDGRYIYVHMDLTALYRTNCLVRLLFRQGRQTADSFELRVQTANQPIAGNDQSSRVILRESNTHDFARRLLWCEQLVDRVEHGCE
jgi:hypothetical protein